MHTHEIPPSSGIRYVLVHWLLSRLLVFAFIFLVAPHVSLPRPDEPHFHPSVAWSQLTLRDGKSYQSIATRGYEYQPDQRMHNITFFPLYPMLVWLIMRTGLSFAVAGTLLSNLAFFGALYLLYRRTAEHFGDLPARWAVAAMAWFPLSLLCAVTYTESVFLFLTLAFLQAFEKQHYWLASLLAAMVAMCRVPGIVLVPTVVWFAYLKRLSWRAYMPAISSCLGLAGFMAFQAMKFHDPLAFVHAQAAYEQYTLSDVIRHFYRPNNVIRIFAWPIALFLLWWSRRELCRLDILYVVFSLLLVLASMRLTSVQRYIFAIAPLFIAGGLWLSKRPRLALAVVLLFAMALAFETVPWAWDHFIA